MSLRRGAAMEGFVVTGYDLPLTVIFVGYLTISFQLQTGTPSDSNAAEMRR